MADKVLICTQMYNSADMRFINQLINVLSDQDENLRFGIKLTQTSCIDVGLSMAVGDFLESDFDYLFSLDYDIIFNPYNLLEMRYGDVIRQLIADCKETGGVVGGPYIRRGSKDTFCLVPLAVEDVKIGKYGRLVEVRYLPTGCAMLPRKVLEKVVDGKEKTRYEEGKWIYPIFQPRVFVNHEGVPVYLTHDYSFSQYVLDAGFKNYVDSRIILGHMGQTIFAPGID